MVRDSVVRRILATGLLFNVLLLLSNGTRGVCSEPPGISPPEATKRYMVGNAAKAAHVVAHGGRIVRETRGLRAVICAPSEAEAMGLTEDIRVQAADTMANVQVLATPLQSMGLTGKGRKIVVLDTGYNYSHPELISSFLGGSNFLSSTRDVMDDNGHGSHVAGIITGDGIDPRARGVAPDAGIIAGKVLDSNGNGYISDVVAGIYWAVDGPDGVNGTADDFRADAINISIASRGTDMYPSMFCDAAVPALTDAVKYASDHGVPVVIAAGNNAASGVGLPGCISYALTVGAVDQHNLLANFSGVGPAVDVVAPGVGLYSASLGTTYKILDGTSQATPVVSGAIALFKEAFPNASMDAVENALFSTAVDLGYAGVDNRYGWGQINAYQAMDILTASSAHPVLSLSRSNAQLLISWPVNPPGFVLQASLKPSAATNAWRTLTNSVITSGNQNTIILPLSAAGQFYRLKWQ